MEAGSMAMKSLVRKCPVRRLGKLLYLSLVSACLVLVLVSLKFYSDVRRGPQDASGLSGQDTDRISYVRGESAKHGGDESASHLSNRNPVNANPEVKTHVHTFPATITTNTSAFRITTGVSGKLGNQMFQYASLLGIAAMNHMLPFYQSPKLRASFSLSHYRDWSFKGFRGVDEKDFATYDPRFEHLPHKNTLIMQYFQSWKYFGHIEQIIRQEFTFKEQVQISARRLVDTHSAKIGNRTRVGIHVRRGDMNMRPLIRRGYHMAPASYVRQAMDYMRHKHPDVTFIVVTDDVRWCRNHVDASDVVYVDWASADVHLAVLASCDHVIMTVGTYGWWGGYLAGGEVLYYWDRSEMLHDPPLPVEIKHPEDFFPAHWVPLTGV